MVLEAGFGPASPKATDFKSVAYTGSATQAIVFVSYGAGPGNRTQWFAAYETAVLPLN